MSVGFGSKPSDPVHPHFPDFPGDGGFVYGAICPAQSDDKELIDLLGSLEPSAIHPTGHRFFYVLS